MPCTDARRACGTYARPVSRPRLLLVPLAAALVAGLPAAAPAAVTSRGDLRTTEGVRLSDLQFRAVVKDGGLRLDLLLVGRATGGDRTLVLSAAPCRGTQRCRVESARAVRFRRRPRTLVGWHPAFRGAAAISALRIRVAERGASGSRATAEVVVAPTAWTVQSAGTTMFVREDRAVAVDALHMVVAPAAGGGVVVRGSFTVTSTRVLEGRTTLGRCTPVGGCPLPDVTGTFGVVAGVPVHTRFEGALGPIANAERVRFRADGGVFPSPFVQMILPWPAA